MSMEFLGIQIAVAIYIYVLTLTSKINGFRIELTPRTSIDSALFPKDLSPEEIHHRIAQLSRARAIHLRSNQEPETLKPPVYPSPFANTNIYITKISIGSTQFSPYLVVDTGSDDTWLQCEGCTSCFPIKGGSFRVKESKTYRGLACEHPLFVPKLCNKGLSSYDWKYKEGSGTKGVLSSESLTLPGDKNTSLTFANVTFGCGYDNQNVSFGGYMGSVSVEGKRLEIDPALFQLKQGGSGGFSIDSGVGPTLLVPEAYEVLKLEILEFYLARGFHPVKVLHVPYDLCYAITPAANVDASVFFPSMVIHFEGADLFLDDTAVMGFVAPQLFCLIFLPTHPSGPNLLGAFQQENQRFLFDVGKSTVSFVSEICNEQE
ncbi:hypothetical protein WN944_007325 [Citrus x changshan-huyou]|uniref:Peptidase A1 domain-containing protein n=3 Tax=Citrus TaxID=2706 RepID=A0AAP0MS65_9ROSI